MAQRRMFSKGITNSSQFLMMPSSTQSLYFHLGMNADDDGFCEHFALMRMTDSKPDDLKILQAKGYVEVFDDKVLVILDWKENNYLRPDRYTASKYLATYKKEIERLTTGIPTANLGKDRLGEDRIGKDNTTAGETPDGNGLGSQVNSVLSEFKTINPSYERFFKNKTQRSAIERLLKKYEPLQLQNIVRFLEKSNGKKFAPTITTPIQLEEKLGALIAYCSKFQDEATQKGKEIIGL